MLKTLYIDCCLMSRELHRRQPMTDHAPILSIRHDEFKVSERDQQCVTRRVERIDRSMISRELPTMG